MAGQRLCSRRPALLGVMLFIAVSAGVALDGCSRTPGAQPELEQGRDVTVGQIVGEDLKLVTEGAGEPARLLGTLTNTSGVSVEVTVRDADDTATVAVSEGGSFSFADNPTLFMTIDAAIGDAATMTITSPGSTQTTQIPVYEGPIGGYVHDSAHAEAPIPTPSIIAPGK